MHSDKLQEFDRRLSYLLNSCKAKSSLACKLTRLVQELKLTSHQTLRRLWSHLLTIDQRFFLLQDWSHEAWNVGSEACYSSGLTCVSQSIIKAHSSLVSFTSFALNASVSVGTEHEKDLDVSPSIPRPGWHTVPQRWQADGLAGIITSRTYSNRQSMTDAICKRDLSSEAAQRLLQLHDSAQHKAISQLYLLSWCQSTKASMCDHVKHQKFCCLDVADPAKPNRKHFLLDNFGNTSKHEYKSNLQYSTRNIVVLPVILYRICSWHTARFSNLLPLGRKQSPKIRGLQGVIP